MKWLSKAWRRLICRHEATRFFRNIYGDEIIHSGGMRSVWRCEGCGAFRYSQQLHKAPA